MKISYALLTTVVGLLIFSCTKDKIVPTAAENNAKMIAGESGSSKSWKMTAASYTYNGSAAQTITLGACVLDNVYKFTNNSTQDYIQTEGATKCNSADSTVTEKGNWAFTNDGKNLVVEGEWFDDLNAEQEFLFTFTTLGQSCKVVTLTDTSLVVTYSFPYTSNGTTVTIAVTITFAKV